MKKVRLTKKIKHPKGNIHKGSIYYWSEHYNMYVFRRNNIVISTVNQVAVDSLDFFEIVNDD